MISTSNYWKVRLPSVSNREIDRAKEFFKLQFPDLSQKTTLSAEENKDIQRELWQMFRFADDVYQRAYAGLCLRCYVSHRIFLTCQQHIPRIYNIGAEKPFSYTDLLPLVLNDHGKTLVILDSEGETQYILNHHLNHHDSTPQPISIGGEFFSVRILQKFKPNLANNESLDNWIRRLTCQNENIKSFLWDLGLATPTDWALLCKTVTGPLSQLFSPEQLDIIQAFQTVYQRDRRITRQQERCSEPTQSQWQEILGLLQQKNIAISLRELISDLKHIAEILRQDWLSRKTGSTKTLPIIENNSDDSTNNKTPELPYLDRDLEDVELENFEIFCNELFKQTLYQIITEVIQERIEELKKSRAYSNFAQRYPEGLRLYYQENLSLGEIGKQWGIEWSKARRIFQLGDFLDIIQCRTEEVLLNELRNKYQLTQIHNDPDYLKNLVESIREFALSQAFKEAEAELVASKKQVKNSLIAQMIRTYLSHLHHLV
ncbi:hypothetical protein NIES4073_25960 [Kalymmatonema gypsitolerans NIES-4073]|nr:hypothetical protein NIES4073_25960 [Scytonema sp. NIES-4073]